MTGIDKEIIKRFSLKYRINRQSECWEWLGKARKSGYGYFRFEGRNDYPHRVSFIIHKGPIPKGMEVCHHCDNRLCVKPAHIYAGTRRQNVQDMIDRKRAHWHVHKQYIADAARQRFSKDKQKKNTPYPRLTPHDIEEIRSLLLLRVKAREIAVRFDISIGSVSNLAAQFRSV